MSDFSKVAQLVNGRVRIRTRSSGSRTCFLMFLTVPQNCGTYQSEFLLLSFISSKLQQVVDNFESLLINKTLWGTGKKREVASMITSVLQTMESNVLETALKAPDQEIQKIQNSTMGKETIWPDTHRGLVTN